MTKTTIGLGAVWLLSIATPTIANGIRMTPNLSPYLHLTSLEFQVNGAFPAYHKLVRPQLAKRQAMATQAFRGIPRQSSPYQSALSPYHHLGRKTVAPFLPVYQSFVRPALEQVVRPHRSVQFGTPISQPRNSFFHTPPVRKPVETRLGGFYPLNGGDQFPPSPGGHHVLHAPLVEPLYRKFDRSPGTPWF